MENLGTDACQRNCQITATIGKISVSNFSVVRYPYDDNLFKSSVQVKRQFVIDKTDSASIIDDDDRWFC